MNIPAAVFKAECLKLMDEVARTGRPIVITKHGPTGQTELTLTPLERLKGSAPPPSRSISPRRGTPSRPRPIPVTASIRS